VGVWKFEGWFGFFNSKPSDSVLKNKKKYLKTVFKKNCFTEPFFFKTGYRSNKIPY